MVPKIPAIPKKNASTFITSSDVKTDMFIRSFTSPSIPLKREVKSRRRSVSFPGKIEFVEQSDNVGTDLLQKKQLQQKDKITRKGQQSPKSLKKTATVSELITATKATAAERVSNFLKGGPSNMPTQRRSSLPIIPKTDISSIGYEMPEVLPPRRLSQILETVPEKLMCLTKRRVSSIDIPEHEFLSVEIKPLESVDPEFTLRTGRRMSLPAGESFKKKRSASMPISLSAVFVSYELVSSDELQSLTQKRRSSLPHFSTTEEPVRDKLIDPTRVKYVDPVKETYVDPISEQLQSITQKRRSSLPHFFTTEEPIREKLIREKYVDPIRETYVDPISEKLQSITQKRRSSLPHFFTTEEPIREKLIDPMREKYVDHIRETYADPISEKLAKHSQEERVRLSRVAELPNIKLCSF